MDIDDNLIEAKVLRMRTYALKGEFDKFNSISEKVIKIASISNNSKYLSWAYFIKGMQLFMKNHVMEMDKNEVNLPIDGILENINKSNDIANRNNDLEQFCRNQNFMAMVYSVSADKNFNAEYYNKAITMNLDSAKKQLEIHDTNGLAKTYHSLSSIYKDMGDYSSSLEWANKSKNIVKEKDLTREVMTESIMIEIELIRSKDLTNEDLEKLYRTSKQLVDSFGHEVIVLNILYTCMGLIKILQKDYNRAIDILLKSRDIGQDLKCIDEDSAVLIPLAKKYLGEEISSELLKLEERIKNDNVDYSYWMNYYLYQLFGKNKGTKYLNKGVNQINKMQSNLKDIALKEFSHTNHVELILEEWEKVK